MVRVWGLGFVELRVQGIELCMALGASGDPIPYLP